VQKQYDARLAGSDRPAHGVTVPPLVTWVAVLLFGFACRTSDVPNSKRAVATSSSQVSTVSTVASSSSSKDAATAAAELKPKPSRPKLTDPLIWIDLEMTGVQAFVLCLIRLFLLTAAVARSEVHRRSHATAAMH
jgi:hypothetical protein